MSSIGANARFAIPLVNAATASWGVGEVVFMEASLPASIPQADAPNVAPYGSPTAAILPTGDLMTTADENKVSGVVLGVTPTNVVGWVLTFGVVQCIIAESADDGSGTAYSSGATAGALCEVTASGTVTTLAVQIGASGATTTLDLRLVFYHGMWGMQGNGTLDPNPLGGV